MTPSTNRNTRELAWNGIALNVPAAWHPKQIGARYLLLEHDSRPAMELKWGDVRGTFSHRSYLRRLASRQDRRAGRVFQAAPLPEEWADAVAAFDVSGFTWSGPRLNGSGVVLFCPECRRVALLQFFYEHDRPSKERGAAILRSFECHSRTADHAWSLFDIRIRLPKEFQLSRHYFGAGKYEIAWTAKGSRLTAYRWSPASFLLKNRDLGRFAEDTLPLAGRSSPRVVNGAPGLEWRHDLPSPGPVAWWNRLTGRYARQCLRLWHLEDRNRIFGVRLETNHPLDPKCLDGICSAYESL